MLLRFEEWLGDQQNRDDLVGDLARILNIKKADQKPSKRRSDEHKSWVDMVVEMTDPGYVPVFNEAWQEFILAKQAAKAIAEGEISS
jgi:hypothetical protein